MKKLFNSRFLFILASSLVMLIVLTIGAFYLFDENDDVFVKGGYVLNPLSSTTEKYFFEENVGYKENLSSMIEFKDVDENVVTILKDSFIHYLDDSMSFLKNGAILDLDSVMGDKAVAFYNITNDSIIEKKDDGYVIESARGDIRLNNFIGRISDNKYIVVGDLNLKMAGNSTMIKGDYFEVVYVEEGIINIENKSVKYQVAAEDTLIHIGSDKVIDFGDKKLTVNGEDIMSITSITIDGNENIEIVPKAPEEEDEDEPEEDSNVENENDNNPGANTGNDIDGSEELGPDDGTDEEPGDEDIDGEETDELKVSLKKWDAASTKIDVIFDVVNATEDDTFMLQVINLSSGRTVDRTAEVITDLLIPVEGLTPDTKYLFTVINKKDNGKYFQKILETTSFGIELEKTDVTQTSLAFKVTVGEDTDIKTAVLRLYQFDEEQGRLVPVTVTYTDANGNEVKEARECLVSKDENDCEFTGLVHNSIYTAVLEDFRTDEGKYNDIYNKTMTMMTLKEEPKVDELIYDKNKANGTFSLSLKGITDNDNAITNYTYRIFEKVIVKDENGEVIDVKDVEVERFSNTNASLEEIKVCKGCKLEEDTNYSFDVVIEWFDNEKYVEYVAPRSEMFNMESTPYIEIVENIVGYNSFTATIYLKDNSCSVQIPGRDGCDTVSENAPEIEIFEVSSTGKEPLRPTDYYFEQPQFTDEDGNGEYQALLTVVNLKMGTTYEIHVKAKLRNSLTGRYEEVYPVEGTDPNVTTKFLAPFEVLWDDLESSSNHVVNTFSKFIAKNYEGALSGEESAAAIQRVTISLYDGDDVNNLNKKTLIATKDFYNSDEFNIKQQFYSDGYIITTDGTFDDDTYFDEILGISVDDLKEWSAINSDGKLNDYYTVMINAYYDLEGKKEVNLDNKFHPYKINDTIDLELIEPKIEFEPKNNSLSERLWDISFDNLDGSTYVAYEVKARFDSEGLLAENKRAEEINFYVYNSNKEKVKFYIKDKNNKLVLIGDGEDDKYTATLEDAKIEDGVTTYTLWIYMDYGKTSYESNNNVMTRGEKYYIGYDVKLVSIDDNTKVSSYPPIKEEDSPREGLFKLTDLTFRQSPQIGMYISKSDRDRISYRYVIKDPDYAVYREKDTLDYGIYYKVNDGEDKKIKLTKVDGEYPKFEGEFTIPNLNKNDIYSLYYKEYNEKTYDENDEVVIKYEDEYVSAYPENESESAIHNWLFEGVYDASDISKYNFKYQIMPNLKGDNKVVIKMLPTEDILERILSYKFTVTDSLEHEWLFEDWKLSSCEGDSPEDIPRCYSIGYAELKDKGMKTEQDKPENKIKIDIQAVYDTGIIDFDVIKEENDNYCILQENNNELSFGNYISFTPGGSLGAWGITVTNSPKGYGKCSLNGSQITYTTAVEQLKDKDGNKFSKPLNISLGTSGYYTSGLKLKPKIPMIVNPKIVAVQEMKSDKNTFSFNSITPKITVSEKTPLLNGSVQSITFDGGIDLNDFKNEGTDKEPKYYLYVETWDDQNLVGDFSKTVRPLKQVQIDENDTGKTLEVMIDGLDEDKTYYFNVYAMMYKNNKVEKTQLFDSKTSDLTTNRVATYSFNSMPPSGDYGLFSNYDFSYVSLVEPYGNRILNTNINLNQYTGTPFNFDIVYVFCNTGTGSECDLESGKYIFKDKISRNEFITANDWKDEYDISEENIEFGKNYKMHIYAMIEKYDDNGDLVEVPVWLNEGLNNNRYLNALTVPSFTATREADLDSNGKPYIDFVVNSVNDPDKTLIDGKYYVKLLDGNNKLAGTMQLIDAEGNIVKSLTEEYDKEPFDATAENGEYKIRIVDIKSDTAYKFFIFGEAYVNNADIPVELRKRVYDKPYVVYSVHDYYGVTFSKGLDLEYSGRDDVISLTFNGASNFKNVTDISCNVYRVINAVQEDTPIIDSHACHYIRGVDRDFEMFTEKDEKRFILGPFYADDGGDLFINNQSYDVYMSFTIKIPGTDEQITLTYEDNLAFHGRFEYGDLGNQGN